MPAAATTGPAPKIKSVAIISAIGETFMFERVRASAFEWFGPPDVSFLEISDWGIDDLVTREASAILSNRYKVVPVKYQEADFDTWTSYNLLRHLRELPPADEDVDTYVVILRDWRGDGIGNSVHQVAGLGLYRRDYENGPPRVGVFASYRIVTVDARNYDIVASVPALIPDGKLPWMALPLSDWPTTQNDISDSQETVLQSDTHNLIEQTLESALDKLLPPAAVLK